MRKVICILIIVFLLSSRAFAGDPCESAKSKYRICTAVWQGEPTYIVAMDQCTKASRWSFNSFRDLESARVYRDAKNGSSYSSCLFDEETKAYIKARSNIVWKEIK